MTLIIRHRTTTVTADAGPRYGGFMFTDNLVAALRPRNLIDDSPDLSNNGVAVDEVGVPGYGTNYVEITNPNDYIQTGLVETAEMTWCALVRCRTSASDEGRKHILSTYRNDGTGNQHGLMLRCDADNTADELNINYLAYADDGASGVVSKAGSHAISGAASADDFLFVALVVDVSNDVLELFIPEIQSSRVDGTAAGAGNTFATRALAEGGVRVGQSYDDTAETGTGSARIAEALFYNRALTASEVGQVYDNTRAFFNGAYGMSLPAKA